MFGYSGFRTSDLQGKVRKTVGEGKTKVILHVGTNDTVNTGSEDIIKNLCSLIQEVKDASKNAEVGVCSIPSRTDNEVAFSRAEGINNRLQEVCRKAGAEYIDLRGYLVSCRWWRARDGVHYSEEGARIAAERLGEITDSFLGLGRERDGDP